MKYSLDLEKYISEHIEAEEDLLKELERETHLKCIHPRMLSGHVQGKILYMFCKMIQAESILELGTYTGYSAISMGFALDKNAHIDTIEIRDENEEIIRKYIDKAGLGKVITCYFGDALDLVPTLEKSYDLVFIDADKRLYPEYYDLVFDKVKPGGYIIADNILWDGKVIDSESFDDPQTKGIIAFNEKVQNDSRVENIILPFRDGMMLLRKK